MIVLLAAAWMTSGFKSHSAAGVFDGVPFITRSVAEYGANDWVALHP